jgi:hypothetical protein
MAPEAHLPELVNRKRSPRICLARCEFPGCFEQLRHHSHMHRDAAADVSYCSRSPALEFVAASIDGRHP